MYRFAVTKAPVFFCVFFKRRYMPIESRNSMIMEDFDESLEGNNLCTVHKLSLLSGSGSLLLAVHCTPFQV